MTLSMANLNTQMTNTSLCTNPRAEQTNKMGARYSRGIRCGTYNHCHLKSIHEASSAHYSKSTVLTRQPTTDRRRIRSIFKMAPPTSFSFVLFRFVSPRLGDGHVFWRYYLNLRNSKCRYKLNFDPFNVTSSLNLHLMYIVRYTL